MSKKEDLPLAPVPSRELGTGCGGGEREGHSRFAELATQEN